MARIVPELRSTTLTRVDLYLEPPPSPCPISRLVNPRPGTSKKIGKCFIIDFWAFLTCFFFYTDIGDFLQIFANHAGF